MRNAYGDSDFDRLPGAELLEQQDERTFLGQIKVKVGPLAMSYKGKGTFTEVNEETHTVRMTGEAREVGGSGSTKVMMVSVVTALENGGSAVSVEADINLVGRIVQFGRGMIEEVSRQMFRQFATCVKSRLETPLTTDETEKTTIESVNEEPNTINATSVGFSALWAIIARFFGRLFGKSSHAAERD